MIHLNIKRMTSKEECGSFLEKRPKTVLDFSIESKDLIQIIAFLSFVLKLLFKFLIYY